MPSVKAHRTKPRRYDDPVQAIRECLDALEPLRNFARLLVTRTKAATRHIIEDSDYAEAKSAAKRLAEIVPAVDDAVKRIEGELISEPVCEPTNKAIADYSYLGKGGPAVERKSDIVRRPITAESAYHLVLKIGRIYLEAFGPFDDLNLQQEQWRERWGEIWLEKRLYSKLCGLPEFDSDWLLANAGWRARQARLRVVQQDNQAIQDAITAQAKRVGDCGQLFLDASRRTTKGKPVPFGKRITPDKPIPPSKRIPRLRKLVQFLQRQGWASRLDEVPTCSGVILLLAVRDGATTQEIAKLCTPEAVQQLWEYVWPQLGELVFGPSLDDQLLRAQSAERLGHVAPEGSLKSNLSRGETGEQHGHSDTTSDTTEKNSGRKRPVNAVIGACARYVRKVKREDPTASLASCVREFISDPSRKFKKPPSYKNIYRTLTDHPDLWESKPKSDKSRTTTTSEK